MISILRIVRKIYNELLLRVKILRYQRRLPAIERAVAKKDRIRVLFFVINIGMWKCDDLFAKLQNDDRFEPFVMSFLYPTDSIEYRKYVQNDIRQHFQKKGFNFISCYNFETNEWFDVRSLHPDIVFYAQPYNIGYKQYLIESLWDMSLFAYIPYCFEMERSPLYHHLLLQEISWKMFYPTTYHKALEKSFQRTSLDNIVVTGYLSADKLLQGMVKSDSVWKKKDKSLKRVIWAPHHSINGKDGVDYSNFLELADDMIEIANKYSDKIQFAFKPHPRLKEKLYKLHEWGIKRTEQYYKKWTVMSNTIFVEGQYDSLFTTSDAMIHDCSTFMVEYLYTGKPLMFIIKENSNYLLNEFGKKCFDLHYHGKTIHDIESFIQDVLLQGNDPMYTLRHSFVEKELTPPNNRTVAENIYQDMKISLASRI